MVLYKLLEKIDKDAFEPHVMVRHNKGALFKKVEQLNVVIHVYDYVHRMRPLRKGFKHCSSLSRYLERHNFDIIYSYNYSSDYSEPLAAAMAERPLRVISRSCCCCFEQDTTHTSVHSLSSPVSNSRGMTSANAEAFECKWRTI